MNTKINSQPVERIYPDDTRVKPQTVAHHMERYRFALSNIKNKSIVLDFGCGTGYGSQMMRDAGHHVTGIDISDEAITYAKEHYPLGIYVQADITVWQPDTTYDAVTFFEVIEHLSVEDGRNIIRRIHDCLSANGIFILSTPRDINDKHNGWHLSRWDFDMIKKELSGPKLIFVLVKTNKKA